MRTLALWLTISVWHHCVVPTFCSTPFHVRPLFICSTCLGNLAIPMDTWCESGDGWGHIVGQWWVSGKASRFAHRWPASGLHALRERLTSSGLQVVLKLSSFVCVFFYVQSRHGFSASSSAGLTWPHPKCQHPTTNAIFTCMIYTKACAIQLHHLHFQESVGLEVPGVLILCNIF